MEQQDPTLVMLDQLLRVLLSETLKAAVWVTVCAIAYALARRIWR